ncbi:bifunctional diaminohydroxyphosphoribosylaminopyrimidine deaminase/5-amino-6-(5-phosphoribosylamino)uracil reductase RibD [Chitinibacter tainanensis]|uniref:bifunctional diaminohydroxyphosphoribosylaminopyrimidine deaminase/5-amino-6-(5-phosphoribosylamino)uracil reductase RibD n=1 Tax=Chitinibacter tainanensis TaxID=230667 RepID=UPI0004058309|nr:bifunctional diaminohydroxyphosphoribosylaminopyrimidine deaminase/5-amino-6-(5-phosphoribosylamino)uracil reductase RibD [Chitinibacter tainanensis]
MSFSAFDQAMMAKALQVAAQGAALTSPNPCVGAVIVAGEDIIGYGHSQAAGGAHAEIMALKMAKAKAPGQLVGATAYVTLEPCSHFGRTPPCANALIGAGIDRVIAALRDPNPLVAGQGLARLANHGIEVAHGLLAEQARELHKGFLSRMIRQRPWVTVKLAASLDGRIALENGQSQWITGAEARLDVQRLRAQACAVLTGVGTVLADDPQLNVRELAVSRQPQRVVLDSRGRTPHAAKVLTSSGGYTHVLSGAGPAELQHFHSEQSCAVQLPLRDGELDLHAAMAYLGQQGFNQVLVEAGGTLVGALLQAGLVDEIILYQAMSLLGKGRGMADFTLSDLADQHRLTLLEQRRVGADQRLTLRMTQPHIAFAQATAVA